MGDADTVVVETAGAAEAVLMGATNAAVAPAAMARVARSFLRTSVILLCRVGPPLATAVVTPRRRA
ncbi:hypothetical protein Sm713_03620 [Streptomyces sp. TS71-3]|nr:hypothetical protein Sm713_03620 [Streptomyces sp. TS71-3]